MEMGGMLGDVHVSGSHRGEPGTDEFDFKSFAKGLKAINFKGSLVVQYKMEDVGSVSRSCEFTKKGNHHTLKIKKAADPTDFSKIPPLIDVDVIGTKLDHGTINVMSYGFADNIVVYVGTKDVKPQGKLPLTWGKIKASR